MLLTLRVDRELDWSDVVAVMADEPMEGQQLERYTSRLRKRFERVEERLHHLARERGLLRR